MKKLLIIGIIIHLISSCRPQYTCPTYMKTNDNVEIMVKKENIDLNI